MKLKTVSISLQASWQDQPGQYKCEVEYEDATGKFTTHIPPEATQALLVVIGEQIVKFSARAALDLQKNIFQSVEEAKQAPALEAPQPD